MQEVQNYIVALDFALERLTELPIMYCATEILAIMEEPAKIVSDNFV